MNAINELTLNSNIFSLGALLGTTGTQDIIRNINSACGGGSFFGSGSDPFRDQFVNFMNQVITPIRETQMVLATTAQQLFNQDQFKAITSEEELALGIPPSMQLGILYHPPIRKMLEEERIDGFGISPKGLREEDIYGIVLNSGVITFTSEDIDKNNQIEITWVEDNSLPELSDEERDALQKTRDFLTKFVEDEKTSIYDPTDYPSLHT